MNRCYFHNSMIFNISNIYATIIDTTSSGNTDINNSDTVICTSNTGTITVISNVITDSITISTSISNATTESSNTTAATLQ